MNWNESHKCDTHNVAQSQNLNVTVVNNKGSSRRVVGECSIELSQLKQLEHSPQWYNLYNNKEVRFYKYLSHKMFPSCCFFKSVLLFS